MSNDDKQSMQNNWSNDARWAGITRPYTVDDVLKLRGSVKIEHTLATLGATRLWGLLGSEDYIHALGAMSGNQAVQMIKGGLKAIYISGWQVAADANLAGEMYPDMSLYPCDSVPALVKRINNALRRADQVDHCDGVNGTHWFAPMVADAEAGFGGNLNAYELMYHLIEAGAAGVHFEDQLSSAKKCGHMGGKVAVPTGEFIEKLVAARLASDVCGVPTVLIARTDTNGAKLLTNNSDERDAPFINGERTPEGFFRFNGGIDAAIARGLAYAPYCDLIWCETAHPDLGEARKFADAIHAQYPGKMLAYNCSPSFNWKAQLDDATIAKFQRELGVMGYKFQFITLAGFHALNLGMFDLARKYRDEGMSAYAELQATEFERDRDHGYQATTHQKFVGTGYFDTITNLITGGTSETSALHGSTEEEQFSSSKK